MNNILTYCNTRQFFTNRWKGDVFCNSFHLSDKELKRFNVTRSELEAMPMVKTVGLNTYNIEGVKEIDISLLKPSGQPLTELHRYMMDRVCEAELPETVESTAYWKTFLKHRSNYPELFFTVDSFAGRVHTPISGMSKEIRPFLLLRGETVVSFDVAQMQPTLLANILYQNIGNNAFSDAIFQGVDVYSMLQAKAGLKTRDEAKKRFFEMIFGKPSNELERLFEGANFIQWINGYKSKPDPRNPHHRAKPYSNLAWLLQTYEVRVMGEVWQKLGEAGMAFSSVHDEIICTQSDCLQVQQIIETVLNKHFQTYKLNSK